MPVTDTPSAARVRLTRPERREAILRAARHEFSRVGYHGASVGSIARASGCSEPMLYKHFAGKRALFTASLEQASETIETAFDAMLAEPGDPMERWSGFLHQVTSDPQYVELLMLRKLAVTIAHEPSVQASLREVNRRHVERTRVAVLRGIEQGTVRADIDPDYVAWIWNGLMLAGCLREVLEPGGFQQMLPHGMTFLTSLRVAQPAA